MEFKICNKCNTSYPLTTENFWTNGKQPVSGKQKWKPTCKTCELGHRATRFDDIVAEVFPVLDCAVCGYNRCKAAIDFHHLDPQEKDFVLSDARGSNFSREKLIAELEKCVPLCCRCHREFHAGIIEL